MVKYSKKYTEVKLEIENQKKLDEQKEILKSLDYSYFEDLGCVPITKEPSERIKALCAFLKIYNLTALAQKDLLANYRSGSKREGELKNIISANAWLQTAINCSQSIDVEPFNEQKLKSSLQEIRSMTLTTHENFIERLKKIFSDCGVAFVLLPQLKNSNINGVVRWLAPDKVLLAINNRGKDADKFWFSLFHEIGHVLQKNIKATFVSNFKEFQIYDEALEKEADKFAQEQLIPTEEYENFTQNMCFSASSIKSFAEQIRIHPGIVVGRLQNDGYLNFSQHNDLKSKYEIKIIK